MTSPSRRAPNTAPRADLDGHHLPAEPDRVDGVLASARGQLEDAQPVAEPLAHERVARSTSRPTVPFPSTRPSGNRRPACESCAA